MRVISRGTRPVTGEPIVHVQYEHDEVRPIYHKRARKHDCDAQIGEARNPDEALQVLRARYGKRCPGCHKHIYGVRIPFTNTLSLDEVIELLAEEDV